MLAINNAIEIVRALAGNKKEREREGERGVSGSERESAHIFVISCDQSKSRAARKMHAAGHCDCFSCLFIYWCGKLRRHTLTHANTHTPRVYIVRLSGDMYNDTWLGRLAMMEAIKDVASYSHWPVSVFGCSISAQVAAIAALAAAATKDSHRITPSPVVAMAHNHITHTPRRLRCSSALG